jgi:glycosyltransferase A (GT-A) superfamily protein (DUF2064 family)
MPFDENQLIVFSSFSEEQGTETCLMPDTLRGITCEKAVFYSGKVYENDLWEQAGYEQNLQKGLDRGERMMQAFKMGYKRRFNSIVLIEDGCKGITKTLVEGAFQLLKRYQVVIGPALHNGYYLIGMNSLIPELFSHKDWDGENILLDTLIDIEKLNCNYTLLKTLEY